MSNWRVRWNNNNPETEPATIADTLVKAENIGKCMDSRFRRGKRMAGGGYCDAATGIIIEPHGMSDVTDDFFEHLAGFANCQSQLGQCSESIDTTRMERLRATARKHVARLYMMVGVAPLDGQARQRIADVCR